MIGGRKFMPGDKVRDKRNGRIDVIKSLPGMKEYDKENYLSAGEGMFLGENKWEFQKNWELIEDKGGRKMKRKTRKAYEASVHRWERILEVITQFYHVALRDDGSKELNIPPCAMCSLGDQPPYGGRCDTCEWFEKCNKENSHWKIIRTHASVLKGKIEQYLRLAKDHLAGQSDEKEEEIKKPTYRTGDRFDYKGAEYLLAQVSDKQVALISRYGNRWAEPTNTKDSHVVTKEEFDQVAGGEAENFKRIF